MNSRERMLAAIDNDAVDYPPCSFMIFQSLRGQCREHAEFVDRQLEMGLDAFVDVGQWPVDAFEVEPDLQGLPVEYGDGTGVEQWRERGEEAKEDLLCREIDTPDGSLVTKVRLTRDWSDLQKVPLCDDWLVARSLEFPVKGREAVPALRHVLQPPSAGAKSAIVQAAAEAREFARQRNLLLQGGWGVGLEATLWLCGVKRIMWAAIDDSQFVDELVAMLHEWNVARMKPMLNAGVDLFVRRGWYEGTTFWSPDQFRRFVFPSLKAEAELVHNAGAQFGYISTSGTMAIMDAIIEAGVDVVIGVDPVQGENTDLSEMRDRAGDDVCLWGGVNGPVTVETGSKVRVRDEVRRAMRILGPTGFILSPVDNVTESTERVWNNIEALIDEWEQQRAE